MTDNSKHSVLIVDDDAAMCDVLALILKKEGFATHIAHDGLAGIEMLKKVSPDVVLLDLRMPGIDGIEVLRRIKKIGKDVPVIIVTAYGRIQSAVEAVKLGAYDYIAKPFVSDDIVITVRRAVKERSLQHEVHTLKTQLNKAMPLFEQMGNSAEVAKINEQVERIAPTNFTVILYGETGSGKELVARSIHSLSPRKDMPFVVVDCGSIPETLIESELFGYEKGAFTGADQRKTGHFEMASGGTLFLDEIGNLPMSMQNKLLRVLQERQLRRLGGNKEIEVDVRIIAAGNVRLESLVEDGRFKMDLYQRLCEFYIEIPPLRKRKDDIMYLCMRFLAITNKELNKHVQGFTSPALETLLTYDWPGNVRELKNAIRRGCLLASDSVGTEHLSIGAIKAEHLTDRARRPSPQTGGKEHARAGTNAGQTVVIDLDVQEGKNVSLQKHVEMVEKTLIESVLKQTNGNKSQASKILKIDYKTLLTKIKEYGIQIQTTTQITSNKNAGNDVTL